MGSLASSGLLPSPRTIPGSLELAGEGDAGSILLSSLSSHLLLSHLCFLVRVTALSPDCVQNGWSGRKEGTEGAGLLEGEDEMSGWNRWAPSTC